jgi:site-specific DNA recombinase
MDKYFSYYRVSSKEQQEGASLEAQREANARYAQEHGFVIAEEFREVQSASKAGRKQFELMLQKLQKSKDIKGVIFHDVDRSARDIVEWGKVVKLQQLGCNIYFSRDNLSLDGRGNKLLANMKAIVAADMVENLKQEVKKGLYKRLEDGYAVIGRVHLGYIAQGKGVRTIDPEIGPLIQQCFTLYAGSGYTFETLSDKMYQLGLRNKSGKKIEKSKIGYILNNKFYIGLMLVKGKLYQGKHEPLVSVETFNKVQTVLKRRSQPKKQKNPYKFPHLFKCALCGNGLRAMSAKKKYRYYGCRNKNCPMKNVAEEKAEKQILAQIERLHFKDEEVTKMLDIIKESKVSMIFTIQQKEANLKLQLNNLNSKFSKLIDLQLSNELPEEVIKEKNNQFIKQRQDLEFQIAQLRLPNDEGLNNLEELTDLLKNPIQAYRRAEGINKIQLIEKIMKDIKFGLDSFTFEWQPPFNFLAKRNILTEAN